MGIDAAMHFLALSLLLVVAPNGAQLRTQPFLQASCTSTPGSLLTLDSARLSPGTYAIVLASTRGTRPGHRIAGSLILHSALATDRSPRTAEAPAPAEHRAEIPLWGSFTGDLSALGVDLPDSNERHIPLPSAEDPIYPGVQVRVQNWQNSSRLRQNTLWVATGANVRAETPYETLDGPGIVMTVRQLDGRGFRGTWGPAGRLVVGGYFCARRVARD